MGFGIGSAIGGAIGAIGSIIGANKSASTAKAMQNQQIDYNKEVAQNALQWRKEDAIKAGFNPLLAVETGGASANGISTPSVDYSGYGQAGGHIINALSTAKTLMNDTQRVENETKTADANVQNTEADTNLKTLQGINVALENKNLPRKQEQDLQESRARTLQALENASYTAGAKTFQTNQDAWNKLHQNQKIDKERDILKKDLNYYELKMYGKGLAEAGKILSIGSAGSGLKDAIRKETNYRIEPHFGKR